MFLALMVETESLNCSSLSLFFAENITGIAGSV
jgi:hypothetical protein